MTDRFGRRAVLAGLCATALAPGAFAFEAPLPRPRPGGRASAVAPARQSLPRAPSGVSGWLAVDLDSGEVLDARNADMPMAPASVAKLPTAVYALERLGPAHRFATRLATRGRIEGDLLAGDLILAGGGDPELDTDALLPLVLALKEKGVRRVAGRFVVDPGPAPEIAAIDPEQPEDAAYNPALSWLNLNFNRVRVEWPAKAAASDIKVTARALRLDPDVRGVRVVSAAGDAPVLMHSFEGEIEVWRIADRELVRKGGRWLPVRQPAAYAGEVFAALAATHGIALPAPVAGRSSPEAVMLAAQPSASLVAILSGMLHHSTNLTAEIVGQAASGMPGDPLGSAAAMNLWAAGFAGFPPGDAGFAFANHSGLTTRSRVAPARLVAFLRAAAKRPAPEGAEPGDARLPGGVARLLRPHRIATEGDGLDHDHLTIAAKTGTMDLIRGLAGYIVTPGGRRLAFAMFSNDLDRRSGGVTRIDRAWMGRARGFEKALLRDWVLMADAGRVAQRG
ncbi:D-alanyl-D-alanine carboxypeptidase/D-alanyl-D-alanine-endopeptidase [Limibaculum sp. FT325]|uniref:D-alanyl-D-alanine carboxypeptidase/D-alanyl-D-alanine endopeptidase n=1 Tax=Thermohalobaculum sediminis TaxID=2939436 RepID=UPI0020BD911E|nr:D-alanyl-D-alanine carboxypeptidase/D-alanyl-D-alanine-endopeptidase [Limibaculum sediminis]MCL5777972.1 D-alanyl-D-alanine carboxypeptidase/D-alanyl-D-alanine-endopeptidase [Limibaculum sediminis]